MADMNNIEDLEELMKSIQVSGDDKAMDQLAEKLKEKLEIDLGASAFRSLAQKVYNLSITRKKHEEVNKSYSGDNQDLQHATSFESTLLSAEKSSSNASGFFRRGRSPGRAPAVPKNPPVAAPRSGTPIRSFFGANKSAQMGNQPRSRSRSPFGAFRKSPPAAASQEEKKENETAEGVKQPPVPSPQRAAFSGRASPKLDMDEDDRPVPQRPASPMPAFRGAAPSNTNMPPQRQIPTWRTNTTTNPEDVSLPEKQSAKPLASPPRHNMPAPTAFPFAVPLSPTGNHPFDPFRVGHPPKAPLSPKPHPPPQQHFIQSPTRNNTGSRPSSPFASRPGLQENSGDEIFAQSPSRPPSRHARSHSYTPRSFHKFSGNDDDDESVNQPQMQRHRKSASDTNFEVPMDEMDGLELPDFNTTTTTQTSAAETVLTPIPRPGFDGSSLLRDQDDAPGPIDLSKTGKHKLRRKDGTPEVTAAISSAFAMAQGSFFGSVAPPASVPTPAVSTQPSEGFPTENTSAIFSVGQPPEIKRRVHVPRRPTSTAQVHSTKLSATDVESFPGHVTSVSQSHTVLTPRATESPGRTLSPMDVEPIVDMGFKMGTKDLPARKKDPARTVRSGRVGPQLYTQNQHLSQTAGPFGQAAEMNSSFMRRNGLVPPRDPVRTMEEQEQVLREEKIAALRNDGRALYAAGRFSAAIQTYSQAISLLDYIGASEEYDTLAVMYSNRAACLLNIGAYEASAAECLLGLARVSQPVASVDAFASDSGITLKVKLLTRHGRAVLKLGDFQSALKSFETAISEGNAARMFLQSVTSMLTETHVNVLSQIVTEATLGKMDANRLCELMDKIASCAAQTGLHPGEYRIYSEALGQVDVALSLAGGSLKLKQYKLKFLTGMKRWREAAGWCERLAIATVAFDGLFTGDLEIRNPLPGVPPAKFLPTGGLPPTDEDSEDAELKLSSRAAAEAVLRLPHSLCIIYLRALRLEERYPAASSSLQALEEFVALSSYGPEHSTVQVQFSWVAKERSKLMRTKQERERGDELFRLGDFDLAGAHYAKCLKIDGEGETPSQTTGNAGGRLHAVLHCNRAACLMAVRRFHEAIDECTAALGIHSRYMKAMLRRARCYVRLHRYMDAISEYERWLELVEEARSLRRPASGYVTPCLFDGPKDVLDADIAQVKRELKEARDFKRRSEVAAQEEKNRRRERSWQDTYSQSSWNDNRSASSGRSTASAHQRREDWHNQQGDSRPWDSFSGRRPNNSQQSGSGHHRSNSWGPRRTATPTSPGSDPTVDHYSVLQIQPSASDGEVRRQYRALAKQCHPDKDKNEGASDRFRRIHLAYETLKDPAKRQQYDAELRLRQQYL